jgi:hypothetical protein
MTLRPTALAAAALLALLARPLAAQEITISGDDRSPAAQLARDILARRNYVRFDRDTILPATFHAPGDVVVYDADVRLEGTIDGSVAVIGGDFFIRPRATIRGDIANLGGGVYTSALATTGRILETAPGAQVAIAGDSAVDDTSAYAARIIPAPVWRMGEVLPCITRSARTTLPPYAAPMDWWPRQTPRIGVVGPSRRITSTETPASLGVHGPGETTIRSGARAAISSTVSSSLRRTSISAPSSPRYCTRFQVKES